MLIGDKRALAYVARIDDIQSIENADKIEVATVDGWRVVIKKDEFKIGDPCVYIEVDSKVPADNPYFDFLKDRNYKVKTIKLRKQISQGLVVPMTILPNGTYMHHQDVTDVLGIKKIEDQPQIQNKSNEDKLKNARPSLVKRKWFRKMMRYAWFKKFAFKFLIPKTQPKSFPKGVFEGVAVTDEERCVIGQTKILTNKGLIPISQIVNQHLDVKVVSVNSDGTTSFKKILDYQKFDNNFEEVMTIEYPYKVGVSGRKNHLCCTPDHKLLTQRGYVQAKELNLDDCLYMPNLSYNDEAIYTLYGTLLGGGHIQEDKRAKGKLRAYSTNGEKQLDYLKYKQKIFNGAGKIVNAGIGSFGKVPSYHWYLETDGYLTQKLKEDIFLDGKKRVTRELLDKITDCGLALWYMDDGSLKYRNGIDAQKRKVNPAIVLNTQSFSLEENNIIADYFRSKGIECRVTKDSNMKKYYHIYITAKGTPVFLARVTPYMCKSMAYKTVPQLENLLETATPTFKRSERICAIPITAIKWGQHKNKVISKTFRYVYDLEIEDNHNFIGEGVVNHNCENEPWVLKDKRPFVVTTKVDGTSSTYIIDRRKRKEEVWVCSRNVRQLNRNSKNYHFTEGDSNVYWQAADKYKILDFLRAMCDEYNLKWAAIQGEIAGVSEGGVKIQGDPHKLGELRFFGFNLIFDGRGRLSAIEAAPLCEKYGIEWVPIIDTNFILPDDFEEFKNQATGPCEVSGASGLREGYVYRAVDDPTFSFKNVSREYLLKNDSY